MPDLFKLRQPLTFPPDQREFVQSVQADSYYHALQISNILGEVAEHGARLFADSLLPLFVYESSRVMLYYVARLLDPNRFDAPAKVREALKAVESNHNVMRIMALVFPVAETLVRMNATLLEEACADSGHVVCDGRAMAVQAATSPKTSRGG